MWRWWDYGKLNTLLIGLFPNFFQKLLCPCRQTWMIKDFPGFQKYQLLTFLSDSFTVGWFKLRSYMLRIIGWSSVQGHSLSSLNFKLKGYYPLKVFGWLKVVCGSWHLSQSLLVLIFVFFWESGELDGLMEHKPHPGLIKSLMKPKENPISFDWWYWQWHCIGLFCYDTLGNNWWDKHELHTHWILLQKQDTLSINFYFPQMSNICMGNKIWQTTMSQFTLGSIFQQALVTTEHISWFSHTVHFDRNTLSHEPIWKNSQMSSSNL